MHTSNALARPLLLFAGTVALLFTSLFAATPARASHFRYGILYWEAIGSPGEILFTLEAAFRRCGYSGSGSDGCPVTGDIITEDIGGTGINFGDGDFTGTLEFEVTAFDPVTDFIIGRALNPGTTTPGIFHTYANTSTSYNANVSSCCRIGALNNRSDGNYVLETIVTFDGNAPPVSSLVPIVFVNESATASFFVPATDPNGDDLRWRVSTDAEAGGGPSPPNLSINPNTGRVTWDNVGLNQTLPWTVQIIIEDLDGQGNVKSKTPVDFFLVITPGIGDPPTCSISPPGPLTVSAGDNLSFTVTATDPDPGDTITLNTGGLPPGATMTPGLPLTGPSGISSTFNWTPLPAQAGTYVVVYSVSDAALNQGGCSTEITVVAPPQGNPIEEVGDAGNIVSQPAQNAQGQPVDQITGALSNIRLDEDCYFITVTDPMNFSAEVVAFGGPGDSQLFLFDEERNGIYSDDDGGTGTLSAIGADAFDAGGGTEGDYQLCVTAWSNDPENPEMEEIFPDGSGTPAPVAGNAVLTSWNRNAFGTGDAAYEVRLTGVGGGAATGYELSVVPLSPLEVAPGGEITFQYTAHNNTDAPVTGDVRAFVKEDGAGGALLERFIISGTLQAGESFTGTYTQQVPLGAPEDTYAYSIKARNFAGLSVVDSETFSVLVEGGSLSPLASLLLEAEATGDKGAYLAARAVYLAEAAEGWDVVDVTPWQPAIADGPVGTEVVTAYPNPSTGSTQIAFALVEAAEVRLAVYDVLGREVALLAEGAHEAGRHEAAFDGRGLAGGLYVVRLEADERVLTQRLTLLR